MHKYVVRAGAIMLTTGKKPNGTPEVTRVLRGSIINGEPDNDKIQLLLRNGSIEEAKTKTDVVALQDRRRRLTAREAARRSGNVQDPVATPEKDVQPLPAPAPVDLAL
jgi:hypothetical protein